MRKKEREKTYKMNDLNFEVKTKVFFSSRILRKKKLKIKLKCPFFAQRELTPSNLIKKIMKKKELILRKLKNPQEKKVNFRKN